MFTCITDHMMYFYLDRNIMSIVIDDLSVLSSFSDWLERTLQETKPVPKLVSVVNPGNPSGTYIPEPLLKVSLSAF